MAIGGIQSTSSKNSNFFPKCSIDQYLARILTSYSTTPKFNSIEHIRLSPTSRQLLFDDKELKLNLKRVLSKHTKTFEKIPDKRLSITSSPGFNKPQVGRSRSHSGHHHDVIGNNHGIQWTTKLQLKFLATGRHTEIFFGLFLYTFQHEFYSYAMLLLSVMIFNLSESLNYVNIVDTAS